MPRKDPERAREYNRKYNEVHREERCAAARRNYAANIEKEREDHRKWCVANPEKVKAGHLRRHGLAIEEYNAMVDAQHGQCAICGCGDEQLCVDHDHSTGVVRGLLCQRCNRGLGDFRDNPSALRKAINYLEL